MDEKKIRLGVSSCLLGEKVRFDGSHKHDRFITGTLGKYVEYMPVCPEVELGLPIPRETLRLVGSQGDQRLVFTKSGEDITKRMVAWAKERVLELEQENLSGFIFKSKSPSSGMERVKLYDKNGVPNTQGVGIFAQVFMQHFPLLPVEEDGRLHDPALRENFIETIFTLDRWREALSKGSRRSILVDFHTRHKLLFMAHSPQIYQQLGNIVADHEATPIETAMMRYQELMVQALRLKTSVSKHENVLLHILGYFKKLFDPNEKQEILKVIKQYKEGFLPLIVPITLFNHFVGKYDVSYLAGQWYLNPHPIELKLRNHV